MNDNEIVIERVINAPRERVWKAFTDEKALSKWWGPNGFTLTTQEFSFKVGERWRFVMHGPDGRDYLNNVVFTEILEPERISHEHGGDNDNVMFHAVISLEALGQKTKVTMRSIFSSAAERNRVNHEYGAVKGGEQTLGRLASYVEAR